MYVILLYTRLLLAADVSLKDFQGTYTYVPSDVDKANIQEGLDRSVAGFNLLFRPVARHILEDAAKIPHRVDMQMEPKQITLTHYRKGDVATIRGPLNQEFVGSIRSDLKHMLRWQKSRLQRLDQTDDGGREVIYRLSQDKKELRIRIKMFSPRLQNPLVYSLRYTRNPSGK